MKRRVTTINRFNQPVDSLPVLITNLSFGEHFNQSVDNLPKFLLHLKFGTKFNQPANCLPSTVTHLSFGLCFNQPFDNPPMSLLHLRFGGNFNHPVDHLPPFLILLAFGAEFNQWLNHLPKSLKFLHFGTSYSKPLIPPLPLLTHLTYEQTFSRSTGTIQKKSHKKITIYSFFSEFTAPSITHLRLAAIPIKLGPIPVRPILVSLIFTRHGEKRKEGRKE